MITITIYQCHKMVDDNGTIMAVAAVVENVENDEKKKVQTNMQQASSLYPKNISRCKFM